MSTILFVGDSFSAGPINSFHIFDDDWTKILAKRLGMVAVNLSQGGTAWWTARKKLIDYITRNTPPEIIVFTHTESGRLPNRHHLGINFSSVNEHSGIVYQSGKLYYENLYDQDFHYWAQQNWYKECTMLVPMAKVIHLKCFEDQQPFEFDTGAVVTPPLMTVSLLEFKNGDVHNLGLADNRTNHLSNQNNRIMADQLLNIIENYDNRKFQLDLTAFACYEK